MSMDANDRQVGGEHYKATYQHWDLVEDLGLGYLEGQVTKYLVRWRKKNGVEDLKKSLHYLQKLMERVENNGRQPSRLMPTVGLTQIVRLVDENKIGEGEATIITMVATWSHYSHLLLAQTQIEALIGTEQKLA